MPFADLGSDDAPQSFIDPITMECMDDPVTTVDGHSYDRVSITQWLETNSTSPATNVVLECKTLTPNHTLRKAIEEWRQERFCMIRSCDLDVDEQELAEGSFKKVSRGVLKRLPGTSVPLETPRVVAVLELRDGSQLRAEAKILVRLARHPRLVRYLGMCTERDLPCLVTEFAELGSLADAMHTIEDALTQPHEVAILQQICSGMEMLACERLVHRDLALRNVLLFAFDKDVVCATSVKVSDFGLTVSMYGGSHATVSNGVFPIRWMAPEALRRGRFSEASDVWAFGITALELFTRGDIPYFLLTENNDVAKHVINKGTPSRPTMDDDVPCAGPLYDDLWTLVQSCWQYKPSDRPTFGALTISLGHLWTPRASRDAPDIVSDQGADHGDTASDEKLSVTQTPAGANDECIYVLKSTGVRVSMQWLFDNGFSRADCFPVDSPPANASAPPSPLSASDRRSSTPFDYVHSSKLTYSPEIYGYETLAPTYTSGSAINPNYPIFLGDSVTFGMRPDVPFGLTLNPSTGALSGTPRLEADEPSTASVTRIVVVQNSSGSSQTELHITVQSPPSDDQESVVTAPSLGASVDDTQSADSEARFLETHRLELNATQWKYSVTRHPDRTSSIALCPDFDPFTVVLVMHCTLEFRTSRTS